MAAAGQVLEGSVRDALQPAVTPRWAHSRSRCRIAFPRRRAFSSSSPPLPPRVRTVRSPTRAFCPPIARASSPSPRPRPPRPPPWTCGFGERAARGATTLSDSEMATHTAAYDSVWRRLRLQQAPQLAAVQRAASALAPAPPAGPCHTQTCFGPPNMTARMMFRRAALQPPWLNRRPRTGYDCKKQDSMATLGAGPTVKVTKGPAAGSSPAECVGRRGPSRENLPSGNRAELQS